MVSEVLHVEKQWVVTEEIHLTQIEERDTVQETVRVNQEKAEVERLDEAGNVVSTVDSDIEHHTLASRGAPETLVRRSDASALPNASTPKRRVGSSSQSILKNRPEDLNKTR